jgi:hypothetical protein
MPFETDLVLRHWPMEDDWEVIQPLHYRYRHLTPVPVAGYQPCAMQLIVVPAGYRTDLASVPRMARMIVNPAHPQIRRSAVVHDYIYSDLTEMFTRAEADSLFRASLLEDGMSSHLAWLVWMAVRWGGRGAWRL